MNNRNRGPVVSVPRIVLWALSSLLFVPTERASGNNFGMAMDAPRTTHDSNLYLFVDDHWIAQRQGLARIHNRARPLEKPIVWPDDPKTETDCAWGNVIREPDGRFRMWYVTMTMGHNGAGPHEIARAGVWGRGDDFTFRPRSDADRPAVESMLGKYAESDDGIHWRKPRLGLIQYRGNQENNIVLTGRRAAEQTDGALTNFDGYTILRDDREANPLRRYKMIAHWESVHFWDNHAVSGSLGRPQAFIDRCAAARGEYITYSPDGLRWEQPLERLESLPTAGGDRLLVVPDHRHERWMAYTRSGGWAYPAFSHSADLKQWSQAEPAKQIRPADVQAPAVECMIPFNYGNQDLGFPCGMDKPKGVFTVMLASRQEQGEWTWVNRRETFIPYGPPGSYCATGAVPLHNEPFLVGDEMLIFFNAFSRQQAQPCLFGSRSIGVARLRRDGFAGLEPAGEHTEGRLTTKPIKLIGDRMSLNVEQRGGNGSVTVAMLDEKGNELPGYGFAESIPITSDAVRAPVTWKSRASLKPLAGHAVRLAMRIRGKTIVYAVAFSGVPAIMPAWALAADGSAADGSAAVAVQSPRLLPPDRIPCERIGLGDPDDYKPCIARMPDGELLLTAFHQHKRDGNKVMEQTLLFRSKDGGKTWSRPEKLNLLGREPYLTALPDGTIFITGHLLAQDVRNPWGYTCGFLHRSTDRGRTWQSIRFESEGIKPGASNHSTRNVLRRADGTLLLGVDYDGGGGPYLIWRSTDNGTTWDKTHKCEPKGFQSKYGFFGGETWLWQARSGKIWALVRVDSNEFPMQGKPIQSQDDQDDHFMLWSSGDGAKTFDRVRDFGDYGEMYMSILRLQDRRLVLTFTVRKRQPPLGVRAIPGVETDDGFQFDFAYDRIMLDTKTGSRYQGGGFGPTVQLDDGTLVTSCSYRGEDDKTHLEVIRWRLPMPKPAKGSP